ncbi:MAG: hypothetical protein LBS81_00680 [Endomicrobium sp.]|jgi:hypothetical protein|nr:hypothetical protein [Endomicrobium sp.]
MQQLTTGIDLKTNDCFIVIKSAKGFLGNPSSSKIHVQQDFTVLLYDYRLKQTDTDSMVEVISDDRKLDPQTKSFSEGYLTGMAS